MILAQWLVPVWSIRDQEQVLRKGVPFHFRTAPIDPHDPFRGEYVILRFALEDSLFHQEDTGQPFTQGEKVAVLLKEIDGEAAVAGVRRDQPEEDVPWLWATIDAWDFGEDPGYKLRLPFDRYYLEQGTGRRTEDLVYGLDPEMDTEEPRAAHAVVRILNGRAAIEDLLVDGRPVREIILEERANR
jgi:uncharacterized membrane-anchored protein